MKIDEILEKYRGDERFRRPHFPLGESVTLLSLRRSRLMAAYSAEAFYKRDDLPEPGNTMILEILENAKADDWELLNK